MKLRDCLFPAICRPKGEVTNSSFFCSASCAERPCNHLTAIPEKCQKLGPLLSHCLIILLPSRLCIFVSVMPQKHLLPTPFQAQIQSSLIYQNIQRHVWNHLVKEQSGSPCRKFHTDWIGNCVQPRNNHQRCWRLHYSTSSESMTNDETVKF